MSDALREAEEWLRESRGYPLVQAPRSLLEAASWRIVAELVRRHPDLRIAEMHPAGGQADCLALVRPRPFDASPMMLFGRPGSARVWLDGDSNNEILVGDFWGRYVLGDDPRASVYAMEALARLVPPATMPASTPTTLVYRVIAAVAAHGVFGIKQVEGRNGFLDSSGYGDSSVQRGWFKLFPGAAARLGTRDASDINGVTAYRFWFVLVDGDPRVLFECGSGRVWWRDGTEHDVMAVYREEGRRIGPTAVRVARDAFE